jgi:hypothetical protein
MLTELLPGNGLVKSVTILISMTKVDNRENMTTLSARLFAIHGKISSVIRLCMPGM